MAAIIQVKKLFLRSMACVYMFAFSSFYLQIRGLYGSSGVLPAHIQLNYDSKRSLVSRLWHQPTLLYLAPYLGFNVQYSMELLALSGTILAFMGVVTSRMCNALQFMLMWMLYLSLFQVGQCFLSYDWDLLLLEAGFISIFLCPVSLLNKVQKSNPSDQMIFFLLRFLLFRVLFSAAANKLSNSSSLWWDLSALASYYQGQALPTPLAWSIHQFPVWFHKTCTVLTIVFEFFTPFIFLVPLRRCQQCAFFTQILLQLMILIHGNYNWFNLLIMVLTLSLIDDEFIFGNEPVRISPLNRILNLNVLVVMLVLVFKTFELKLGGNHWIDWKITFVPDEFDSGLRFYTRVVVVIATLTLVTHAIKILKNSQPFRAPIPAAIRVCVSAIFYIMIAFFMFSLAAIQLISLDGNSRLSMPSYLSELNNKYQPFRLANSYGAYHSIDSAGRADVVLEGAANMQGPWVEIPFRYKTGDVEVKPSFIIPYQPRLDWQMWIVASNDYEDNPWLDSLTYRLLTNESNVVNLLDSVGIQKRFQRTSWPPKYIRGSVYLHQFTTMNTESSQDTKNKRNFWRPQRIANYLPARSVSDQYLINSLTKLKLLGQSDPLATTNSWLTILLDSIWDFTAVKYSPHWLIWLLVTCAATIVLCERIFYS